MTDDLRLDDDSEPRDPAIARVVAFARTAVAVREDLVDRVLAEIRSGHLDAVPGPRRHRSGARHLALAAAIAALMLGSAWIGRLTAPRHATPAVATAPAVTAGNAVRFVVAVPGAERVSLVGDFNAWNLEATPLAATEEEGVWSVTVPLPAGRHEYSFVVDGERWLPDPNAPRAGTADFGPANSVITVAGRT
jgi:hypothetical protein